MARWPALEENLRRFKAVAGRKAKVERPREWDEEPIVFPVVVRGVEVELSHEHLDVCYVDGHMVSISRLPEAISLALGWRGVGFQFEREFVKLCPSRIQYVGPVLNKRELEKEREVIKQRRERIRSQARSIKRRYTKRMRSLRRRARRLAR